MAAAEVRSRESSCSIGIGRAAMTMSGPRTEHGRVP